MTIPAWPMILRYLANFFLSMLINIINIQKLGALCANLAKLVNTNFMVGRISNVKDDLTNLFCQLRSILRAIITLTHQAEYFNITRSDLKIRLSIFEAVKLSCEVWPI